MVASTTLHRVPGLHRYLVDGVEEQLVQVVGLQQMTKFSQRHLVRLRICHEVNTCEFPHDVAIIDGILGKQIGQVEPDLKHIHPQHFLGGQPCFPPLGIVRLDDTTQNDLAHDIQERLLLGFLLAGLYSILVSIS